MAPEIWVNIGLGNGIKPLPEPILTDHQWNPVTFILGQFHKRCLNHQSLKSVKITCLKCRSNLPEANESTTVTLAGRCTVHSLDSHHPSLFSLKTPSYEYGNAHYKPETVVYSLMWIPIPIRRRLQCEQRPWYTTDTFIKQKTRQFEALTLKQNGHHLAEPIFICILLNENLCILIEMALKVVRKSPFNNTDCHRFK